ncbi:MAG: transporter substrate-binding domain-containing protein [Hyphomicrobiaceae bacterium]
MIRLARSSFAAALACCAAGIVGLATAAAAELPAVPAAIKAKGKLLFGSKCDYPPDGFLDEKGKAKGIEVDMGRQIAKWVFGDEDKIEIMCVTTANRVPSLVGGRIDLMIATMGITKQRREVVEVSDAYAWGASDLLVPKGSPIKSLANLKGKKLILIKGAWQIPWFEKNMPGLETIKLDTVSDAVQALLQGRADAYGHDLNVLYGLAAKNPKVALVGDPYMIGFRGAAVRKGEKEWAAYVNAALAKMRKEGLIKAMIEKYVEPALREQHLTAFDPDKAPASAVRQ